MAEPLEPGPLPSARFPFRSKLMALFVFLVLALLILSLGLFNRQMRRHFRQRIQLNLTQAAELASELMTVRQQRLEQFGLTLSG
ncbi:MAG: hypothetical protein KDC71_24130, partial [Acidobacteria bacterium]|nr:hypothetical protein [Acidobacteriota bacterium]